MIDIPGDKIVMRVKRAEGVPKDWPLPTYHTLGAACFDLRAFFDDCRSPESKALDFPLHGHVDNDSPLTVRTGLIFEVPDRHVLLIFSRSGHGFKEDIRLANCVGIIDSDYRDEIRVKLTRDTEGDFLVTHGDRIAQGMLIPYNPVHLVWADKLSETVRGTGGYGSTGYA
jgi:dUTP pyrophosphatase